MKKQGIPFNKETYLLAFAICYKLDNLESCRISAKLLEEAQLKGDTLPLRAFCFAVATALKQVRIFCFGLCLNFYSSIVILATVREKMEENADLSAKLGDIYTKLQASGRITMCTLEDMLFQISSSKKAPAKLLNQKQLGYQAAKSLQSNLLLE
uniref:PTCD2 n=1 Tax=Bubo bubo TaxID=30461 RepID=A0A8C0EHL9_BUBBB